MAPGLREEFNQWALAGKGESMARHHRAITERAIAQMDLQAGDRVLDLGCGSGWACRLLAPRVGPRGLVVGVDISDGMIHAAQQDPANPPNTRFLCAPAEHIPWPADFFTHVLSVESFYYYTDQAVVLEELRRLTAPGACIFLLICLYQGSPGAQEWLTKLNVPVHLRTPAEYVELLRASGWLQPRSELFQPDSADPNPDPHAHALLLTAVRP